MYTLYFLLISLVGLVAPPALRLLLRPQPRQPGTLPGGAQVLGERNDV
jgi:hypothetical protein